MNKPVRLRRTALAGACALLCLTLTPPGAARIVVLGDDLPAGPMKLDHATRQELSYGEILFRYYGERRFDALTHLLVTRDTGLFNDETYHAELLAGDLFVSFGLSDAAEKIFDRLLQKDILQQLRAETWLRKAALDYRRGKPESAIRILASERTDGLPPEEQTRRHLMLANILIEQERFTDALVSLSAIPADSIDGIYATYNMGVAMIRAGHVDDGVRLLAAVVALPPGDEERNGLKDRAALAIGLTELRRERPERAREALSLIRADSPFSNEAMLSLGLANFELKDFRRALALWLELSRRNTGHVSVQEALMLAPRAYEELGAKPAALTAYQHAIEVFRQELKLVELAIRDVDRRDWLDRLAARHEAEYLTLDPMAPLSDYRARGGPETAYLYRLFASHQFTERFTEYNELKRIRGLLLAWRKEVPALREAHANQRRHFERVLPRAADDLKTLRNEARQLLERGTTLQSDIPRHIRPNDARDLAALPQLAHWDDLDRLDAALRGQPENATTRALRERLQRVRGVLLYDVVHEAPTVRQQQLVDIGRIVAEADMALARGAAVDRLVDEAEAQAKSDIDRRLATQHARIDALIRATDALLDETARALTRDALRVLAEARMALGNQLAEAHLAVARLQDASVVERLKQGDAE